MSHNTPADNTSAAPGPDPTCIKTAVSLMAADYFISIYSKEPGQLVASKHEALEKLYQNLFRVLMQSNLDCPTIIFSLHIACQLSQLAEDEIMHCAVGSELRQDEEARHHAFLALACTAMMLSSFLHLDGWNGWVADWANITYLAVEQIKQLQQIALKYLVQENGICTTILRDQGSWHEWLEHVAIFNNEAEEVFPFEGGPIVGDLLQEWIGVARSNECQHAVVPVPTFHYPRGIPKNTRVDDEAPLTYSIFPISPAPSKIPRLVRNILNNDCHPHSKSYTHTWRSGRPSRIPRLRRQHGTILRIELYDEDGSQVTTQRASSASPVSTRIAIRSCSASSNSSGSVTLIDPEECHPTQRDTTLRKPSITSLGSSPCSIRQHSGLEAPEQRIRKAKNPHGALRSVTNKAKNPRGALRDATNRQPRWRI